MKKALTLSILAALGTSMTASAQDVNNNPNLYGGINYSIPDTDWNVDNGSGFHVGGEMPFTERWSGTLEYWSQDADEDLTAGESEIDYTRIGGNYHLPTNGKWQPYLALGIGSLDVDPSIGTNFDNTTALDLGIGAKVELAKNWFLRGDVKALRGQDSTRDFLFGLAVGYAFGGSSAPAAPARQPEPAAPVASADSDGDGVPDSADACRNTPAGASVDSRGCELDNDRDGVVNSRDNCPNTAMNLAVDARGCPVTETVEHRLELLVNFDTNQAVVKPEFNQEIRDFAEFMEQFEETDSVVIEGHTDSDGAAEYNEGLSQRRADAVMNAIIAEGVSASRMSAIGYGESRPVAPNTTAEGKARNRRIEAVVEAEETVQRAR